MVLTPYEYYPAAAEAVRSVAGRLRSGTRTLDAVTSDVRIRHRGAVAMTSGELVGAMGAPHIVLVDHASKINRHAYWCAVQLERFADAIETYDRDSADPMSIDRLNQKIADGAAGHFGIDPDDPSTWSGDNCRSSS